MLHDITLNFYRSFLGYNSNAFRYWVFITISHHWRKIHDKTSSNTQQHLVRVGFQSSWPVPKSYCHSQRTHVAHLTWHENYKVPVRGLKLCDTCFYTHTSGSQRSSATVIGYRSPCFQKQNAALRGVTKLFILFYLQIISNLQNNCKCRCREFLCILHSHSLHGQEASKRCGSGL